MIKNIGKQAVAYLVNGILFSSKELAEKYVEHAGKNKAKIYRLDSRFEGSARGKMLLEQEREMLFAADSDEDCEKWVNLLNWILISYSG